MKSRKLFCLSALSACILSSYSVNAFETDSIETFNIWHNDEIAERGLALGELTLRKPSKENPVLIINDSKVLFNDSGRDGDKKEGDGIYSAFLSFDAKDILAGKIKNIKDSEEIDKKLSELIKFPKFEGRFVSEDEELVKTLVAAKENPDTYKKLEILKQLEPEIEKIDINKSFESVGFNAKDEPMFSIRPRVGRASLISVLGIPDQVFLGTTAENIDPASMLMITNSEVIEDRSRTFNVCKTGAARGTPGGVWTFSYLMKKLAVGSGLTPEQYTLDWLNTWANDQTLANGSVANKRTNIVRVIQAWLAESQRGGSSTYNLDYFPAALMGIVNRSDTGIGIFTGQGGYNSSNGEMKKGETRFVFALLSRSGSTGYGGRDTCETIPFTVIFEYNNPVSNCQEIKDWQIRWQNLLFPQDYNAALADLTTSVVNNGSLLAHLRTNEIALAKPWELREFVRGSSGQLRLDPLDATPKDSLNNTTSIPACLSNSPSCEAATSTSFASISTRWKSPNFGGNQFVRFNFALNTCNGCHTVETGTDFTHIGIAQVNKPFSTDREFALSNFLTGKSSISKEALNFPHLYNSDDRFNPFSPPIIDPSTGAAVSFNDLARRQTAMANVIDTSCSIRIRTINAQSLIPIDGTNFNSIH